MLDFVYARSLPVGVRHVGDNLAVPALDDCAARMARQIFLAGQQSLVFPFKVERINLETGEIKKKSEFRVSVCGRHSTSSEGVKIYRNESAVGFSGVMRCGNVWACPICAAKVMRLQGERISQIFEKVHELGGCAFLVTFTASHTLLSKLATQLDNFKSAKRHLTSDRSYRRLTETRLGSISATEITYSSKSGWHPHQHDAWFFDSDSKSIEAELLAEELFPLWKKSCEKFELETLEFYKARRIGVDVRPSWNAAEYLTKFSKERDWSLSSEMTAGRLKLSKGSSLTPWAILEDAIIRGKDSHSFKLWLEYLRATKGKNIVSLKGCTKLLRELELPTSFDDFKDANRPGEGSIVATLSPDFFDQVVRMGGLGRILEAARKGGLSEVDRVFQTEFQTNHKGI